GRGLRPVGPVDVDEDLRDGREGRDRDLVADLDGGQQFGEIRVLTDLHAMLESELQDALRDGTAAARDHARRIGLAAVVAKRDGDGGLLRGRLAGGQRGFRSAGNSRTTLEK